MAFLLVFLLAHLVHTYLCNHHIEFRMKMHRLTLHRISHNMHILQSHSKNDVISTRTRQNEYSQKHHKYSSLGVKSMTETPIDLFTLIRSLTWMLNLKWIITVLINVHTVALEQSLMQYKHSVFNYDSIRNNYPLACDNTCGINWYTLHNTICQSEPF